MARFDAQEDPTFQRSRRLISAITNSNPAQITTTFDHDYESGDIVRIYVPKWFGMIEADRFQGKITVTGSDSFTVDFDTTLFTPFAIPIPVPWYVNKYPEVLPVGEISENLGGATKNTLPH